MCIKWCLSGKFIKASVPKVLTEVTLCLALTKMQAPGWKIGVSINHKVYINSLGTGSIVLILLRAVWKSKWPDIGWGPAMQAGLSLLLSGYDSSGFCFQQVDLRGSVLLNVPLSRLWAVPYLQPQFSETSRKSHCFAVFPVFFLVGIMEWWLLSSLYVRAETWGPREPFSYTNSPSEKFLNKVSVVVNHRQDFLFMEIKKKMEKKKKKEKYKEECPEDTCIPVCLLRAK